MTSEPMTARDQRWSLFVLIFILACAGFVWLNYSKAFPEASIDLRLSKNEIRNRAQQFLSGMRLSTNGFYNTTLFDPDDDARLYLEHELGLEEANRLMQGPVSVWQWRVRWFRPPEKEERIVFLNPAGRLVGYEHIIPEAEAGAKLEVDAARNIATQFLAQHASSPGHIVEERAQQRPNRTDHVFTWEQDGFKAKDATYRRRVVVQGDRVGRYEEGLHLPESWNREFAAMRSRNELYAQIAQAVWLPLILAAIVVAAQALRRRSIPWKPLIVISGVVGGLMTITQVNSFPLLIDRFPTSSPFPQTVLLVLLGALGAGMGSFLYIIVAAAAGEPTYRAERPGWLSLKTGFTRQGIATREFFRACVAGYGLAAAHMAFLVAFYLLGRMVGVWSPQDVQYSDLLSTALPWIYPVTIASLASTSEEFWFRLFAIPLLKRVFKSSWIAVLVPAFVWGFLHANYPQQPAYIRGIEVGLIGVAAGIVMLRYGIVATLVWHYVIDALLIGFYLFESAGWYYRLSGIVLGFAILLPLLLSLRAYRRNKGFIALEEPVAVEEPAAPVEPEPVAAAVAPLWPATRLYAAAAVAVILIVVARPVVYGDFIGIRVSRTEAQNIARGAVTDPDRWQMATDFIANLDTKEFEYLRDNGGAPTLIEKYKATAIWRTRFFRPLDREERIVYVDQSGRIIRKDHVLDEKAPGASLTSAEATAVASAVLPSSDLKLVDSRQEKRDNRVDHALVFEDPNFQVGEAKARVWVEVRGDEPSNLRRFIKLPEAWEREFDSPSLRDFTVPAILGSIAVPLVLALIQRIARHETVFHWRAYWALGGAAAAVMIVSAMNNWPTAMISYDTAVATQNYLGQYILTRLTLIVLAAGGIFAGALALDVFRQSVTGRAALNRPSILRAIAVAILIAGVGRGLSWLTGAIPGPRKALTLWSIGGLDSFVPGWRVVSQSYMLAMAGLCVIGILVYAIARHVNPQRRVSLAFALAVIIALGRSFTPWQLLGNIFAVLVTIVVCVVIVRTCGADLISIGAALFWVAGLSAALELAMQPSKAVQWNGIGAAVAVVLIGLTVIWMAKLKRPSLPSQ